ncbi:MAG: hypothetical protein QM811_29485 [Pirellulales bacterium]
MRSVSSVLPFACVVALFDLATACAAPPLAARPAGQPVVPPAVAPVPREATTYIRNNTERTIRYAVVSWRSAVSATVEPGKYGAFRYLNDGTSMTIVVYDAVAKELISTRDVVIRPNVYYDAQLGATDDPGAPSAPLDPPSVGSPALGVPDPAHLRTPGLPPAPRTP